MLWRLKPIIVAIGPTPKHTEKSITQIIVGIARTKEEKLEIIFLIMPLEIKNFVLKIAKGKERKTIHVSKEKSKEI